MERERIYALAKIEATSGTDSVPDPATDAVATVGVPTIKLDYLEPGAREDVQNGTLINADRADAAGRWARSTVTLEVKGGGSAGSGAGSRRAPARHVRLQQDHERRRVGAVHDDRRAWKRSPRTATRLQAVQARRLFATMKLSAEAAKRGLMTFSVTGKLAADPTQVRCRR
jgi:hypothetical protein